MKKLPLLLLSLLALLLTACDSEPQTVTIKNKYSVVLPSFLTPATDLNENASLQYKNETRNFYVVVVDEPRKTFDDIVHSSNLIYAGNLDGYTQLLVDGVRKKLHDKSTEKPAKVTINGLPARLSGLSGTLTTDVDGQKEKVDVYWKLGFLQGRKDYYQVLCWTSAENKEKYEAQMNDIIHSFKEVDKSRKK